MKRGFETNNVAINENASLKEALVAISDNHHGAIVVVDERGVYRGLASDGDIRRAMVQGAILETPISHVVNLNARVLTKKERKEAKKIMTEATRVTLLPVVDGHNKVIEIIMRDELFDISK
jgi:CBS domain-containing protein